MIMEDAQHTDSGSAEGLDQAGEYNLWSNEGSQRRQTEDVVSHLGPPPLLRSTGELSSHSPQQWTTSASTRQSGRGEATQNPTMTGQPVQLTDLMQLIQLQTTTNQALEERRLRLEEEKMKLERERLAQERTREANRAAEAAQHQAARLKERELDRRLKEVPQLPRMTEDEDVEMYLMGFEKRMKSLEIRGWTTFAPFCLHGPFRQQKLWVEKIVRTMLWSSKSSFRPLRVREVLLGRES